MKRRDLMETIETLTSAAKAVVENWECSGLAAAVHNLEGAIEAGEKAIAWWDSDEAGEQATVWWDSD